MLTQQGEPESRNGRLDAAVNPPAEASSVSGATPRVCWKEESSILMRNRDFDFCVLKMQFGFGPSKRTHSGVKFRNLVRILKCPNKHRIALRSTPRFGFAGVPNALNVELNLLNLLRLLEVALVLASWRGRFEFAPCRPLARPHRRPR